MRADAEFLGANPEFARNLWLEFGLPRIVLTALVLGAVFILAHLADELEGGNNLANAAHVLFVLIVLFWGTRMAADGVIQEINARTWDGQRMSAVGPWPMSWGKLFGATFFAWFGGIVCAAVYAVAMWNIQPHTDTAADVAGWIAAGILAHALSLLVSIIAIQKGRTPGRLQVTLFQGIGLAAGVAAMAPYWSGWSIFGTIGWFGWHYHPRHFLLFSFAAFAVWAVAGLYFMMRRELQLLNGPLPWLVFVLFCLVFTAGLDVGIPVIEGGGMTARGNAWLPLFCGFVLLYAIAFSEPKDAVSLRQLAAYAGQRDFIKAAYFMPRTAPTLAVVIAVGIWMIAFGYAEFYRFDFRGTGNAVVIASLLFLIRDAALIFYATAGRTSARSDYVALTLLFLLYFLLPGIVLTLDWKPLLALFLAVPGRGAVGTIAPPLIEAAAVGTLLYFRARKILRAKG